MLFVVIYIPTDLATQETQDKLERHYTKLTHWSFLVLTIHLVLLWVICIVHYRKVQTDGKPFVVVLQGTCLKAMISLIFLLLSLLFSK